MTKPDESKSEGTNPATCPWCAAPVDSEFELEDGRYDCESCQKSFDLVADRSVFYTTKKVEEETETKEGGD